MRKCLRCRPSGGLVNGLITGVFLVFVGACLAAFGAWLGAMAGWLMGLFPLASFGSFAVFFTGIGLVGMCKSLRNWWRGVEPAEPREKCADCGKPGPVVLNAFLVSVCSECEERNAEFLLSRDGRIYSTAPT